MEIIAIVCSIISLIILIVFIQAALNINKIKNIFEKITNKVSTKTSRFSASEIKKENLKYNGISKDYLQFLKQKNIYIESSRNETLTINSKFWLFIKTHKISDFVNFLMDELHSVRSNSILNFEFEVNSYLAVLDKSELSEILYKKLSNCSYKNYVTNVIIKNNLIDFTNIGRLLNSDNKNLALKILNYDKEHYKFEDIDIMEKLIDSIEFEFVNKCKKITKTIKKRLKKDIDKEYYVCTCGHEYETSIEYCSSCNKNIYGFVYRDILEFNSKMPHIKTIKKLTTDITILKEIFEK